VQIENIPDKSSLDRLRSGILLNDGITKPAKVKIIDTPNVWNRVPPIRERKNVPTSWIELKIKEGRNRQVRRMTAAIGFPTLRLIRYAIGYWNITGLNSGEWKESPYSLNI
jgi:23S rRNA pseudouridine2457 synthase